QLATRAFAAERRRKEEWQEEVEQARQGTRDIEQRKELPRWDKQRLSQKQGKCGQAIEAALLEWYGPGTGHGWQTVVGKAAPDDQGHFPEDGRVKVASAGCKGAEQEGMKASIDADQSFAKLFYRLAQAARSRQPGGP